MKHAGEQPDTEQLAEELLEDTKQGFMFWPLLDKGVLPTVANLMLWTACMRLKKALTQAESDLTTAHVHLDQAAETTRKTLKRCSDQLMRQELAPVWSHVQAV